MLACQTHGAERRIYLLQQWLRGGAEQHRAVALLGQKVYGVVEQVNALDGQRLHLVKNQDRVCQLMHAPRAARAGTKQCLQKLNHRGVDHRCVPVFAQDLLAPGLLLWRDAAMVLKHDPALVFWRGLRLQHGANHLRVLVNDRGERDHVDDAVELALLGVMHRKTQTGQRLAAAGGHRQCVDAIRPRRGLQAMRRDFAAKTIDGAFGGH